MPDSIGPRKVTESIGRYVVISKIISSSTNYHPATTALLNPTTGSSKTITNKSSSVHKSKSKVTEDSSKVLMTLEKTLNSIKNLNNFRKAFNEEWKVQESGHRCIDQWCEASDQTYRQPAEAFVKYNSQVEKTCGLTKEQAGTVQRYSNGFPSGPATGSYDELLRLKNIRDENQTQLLKAKA